MTIDLTNATPKPFLKWAGGKAQLLPQILNLISSGLIPRRLRRIVE
jgi:site-specific DNA-adenine methylase